MGDLLKKSTVLAENLCALLDDQWVKVTKADLEKSDSKAKFSLKGSYLYVAYDKNDQALYVGETQVSVRRRFLTNGNSAHKHKEWYKNKMTYLEYIQETDLRLPTKNRRMLEQALSIHLSPENYK